MILSFNLKKIIPHKEYWKINSWRWRKSQRFSIFLKIKVSASAMDTT
jgi:hypothetical protein